MTRFSSGSIAAHHAAPSQVHRKKGAVAGALLSARLVAGAVSREGNGVHNKRVTHSTVTVQPDSVVDVEMKNVSYWFPVRHPTSILKKV